MSECVFYFGACVYVCAKIQMCWIMCIRANEKQIPSPSCTHFTDRFFLLTYIVCPLDSLLLASLRDDEMRRASST